MCVIAAQIERVAQAHDVHVTFYAASAGLNVCTSTSVCANDRVFDCFIILLLCLLNFHNRSSFNSWKKNKNKIKIHWTIALVAFVTSIFDHH